MDRPAFRPLDIRFTGSGSEYFRIWVVNLLLSLLTLGLYLPFAKARRIRYFYANTLIDGHALSFYGDPWKMFRGFMLLVVMAGLFIGFSKVSDVLGSMAFIALLLIWPPLWRAGMGFRLTHTGWRGLRFGFAGSLSGAYKAFLPIGLPLLLVAFVDEHASRAALALAGFGALFLNLMLPWTLALAKRYQHNHYRCAGLQTRTWLQPYQVYGLSFRAGAVGSVAIIVIAIFTAGLIRSPEPEQGTGAIVMVVSLYMLVYLWMSSAFVAGLQNMVWSSTSSVGVHFASNLSAWKLATLTTRNWLLMVLTLGLYRPFAAVATTRLRLAAMRIETDVDIDVVVGSQLPLSPHAAGEFVVDFFGIDVGL
jgi:uncharacterized membrane protein YjgN (DUF898 family)